MADSDTLPKIKYVLGGPVLPRIKYDIKVTDGGMPSRTEETDVCHLCSVMIYPFDCICRDKDHPQRPMYLSCFESWLSTLDADSNTGNCPMPNCTDKHDVTFKKNDPNHRVWTFRRTLTHHSDISADDANEYARLFLIYMLSMNSFEIENLDNFIAFRDYFAIRNPMAEPSIEKLQKMKASEWNLMSWPQRIEILAAHRIALHPKSTLWITAANGGRSLYDFDSVQTREVMLQVAVDDLLEYISKLVTICTITIELATNPSLERLPRKSRYRIIEPQIR